MPPLFNAAGECSLALLHWIAQQPAAVLLECTRVTAQETQSLVFTRPVATIQTHERARVPACLSEMEHALRAGYHLAGYLAYEAGYAFEANLPEPKFQTAPLLWFGVYESPLVYDHRAQCLIAGENEAQRLHEQLTFSAPEPSPLQPAPSLRELEYAAALATIKNYIACGDTYQVNYTFKLNFSLPHTAAWYQILRRAQRVSYAALLALPQQHLLSFSPELFFRLEENQLTLRPMKGTAPRGRTTSEDEQQRLALLHSEKDRAENVMIVDLLRNDAGRIAETGSVHVPRLFEIERYETVLQATSTITARVPAQLPIAALLRALFPCGSITGAPKLRTMQLIHELEREPRGVYTGAIGYFTPQRKAVFSVAIRTVVVDRATGTAAMGVGSGVVWDSVAEAEYRECLLKARFLTAPQREFALLETMRWERAQGCALLHAHLQRLQDSAAYFDFKYDEAAVREALQHAVRNTETQAPELRVRLALDRHGACDVRIGPLEALLQPVRAGFAPGHTNSQDRFLFHKTTRREFYEHELTQAQARGWFDAIFVNERGEVTEGCRSNVIIKLRGEYLTPPLACGVLPGVYRGHVLVTQVLPVREKIILPEELEAAEEIWLCNALRGLVRARLIK